MLFIRFLHRTIRLQSYKILSIKNKEKLLFSADFTSLIQNIKNKLKKCNETIKLFFSTSIIIYKLLLFLQNINNIKIMHDELFYRLALPFQAHYGPASIKKLLHYFGSATEIFQNFSHKIRKLEHFNTALPHPAITAEIEKKVLHEIAMMERHGIRFCFYCDDNFPARLRACNDSPYYFFYKGNDQFNYAKSVAVVGTRQASTYGCDVVRKLLQELASYDLTVVSGLATGIDTEAHQQSLANGLQTVAVMGCGLKRIYPSSNQPLARQILDNGGTLISEYFYDILPDRQNFPQRNRIIAGLSDATIVIETARKGGSIITAHIAHSYNRDVFAVPGNLFQPNHDGCHELIRKNIAALVQSGQDVVEMMNWDLNRPLVRQPELFVELTQNEQILFDFIRQKKEAYIDQLIACLPELSVSKVTSLLLGLEFKGIVECRPGKKYVCMD